MAETKPVLMRLDTELLAEFTRIHPGRGDVGEFVHQAMREYVRLWGDRPTPLEVVAETVANVYSRYG